MARSARSLAALALAGLAAAQSPYPLGLQTDMPLHVISAATAAAHPRASCLDGTLPGFYWRRAAPGSETRWRIHLRGGGWATSTSEAASRRNSEAGSTSFKYHTPFFNGTRDADWGLMSNSTRNPFSSFHQVFTIYCDGSSYASSLDAPLATAAGDVYFRGLDSLLAMLAELEAAGGLLSRATDVILTGTSAGGMAVYLHADRVRALLPAAARFAAVPDAGMFADAPDYKGVFSWRATLQGAFALWNATAGAHAACAAATPRAAAWRCIVPQYAYAASTSRFFIVQSQYDTAQLSIVFKLPCSFAAGTCSPAEAAAVAEYARELGDNVTAARAAFGARDGAFLTSCAQHEETCTDYDFGGGDEPGITIGAQNGLTTLAKWMAGEGTAADWARRDGPFPGDATCAPFGARHGGC